MFLTLDTLERHGACDSGKKWFARYFPNGGELIDVLRHPRVSPEILHWGYNHLTTSLEEQEIYWKQLNISTPARWSIYESDNITNGSYITRSSRVTASDYVFSCKDIVDSNSVSASSFVERSRQIFDSEFVYDSQKVYMSKNVNQSMNIVNSDYCVRSSSIMNAAVVTRSHYVHSLRVGVTKQVTDSAFIIDCTNIKHCLFCANLDNKEYMIFNQPVEPEQFDMIMTQMKNLLAGWQAEYVKDEWPEEMIPLGAPQLQRNIAKQFAHLPEPFWRWVRTLPNYNSSILYSITFQGNLIKE